MGRVMPLPNGTKKCKAQLLREKKTEETKAERYVAIRNYTIAYATLASCGLILLLVGVVTTVWYNYENNTFRTTTSGDRLEFYEYWGMGIHGIKVSTEYCSEAGACLPDVNAFWYFEAEKNEGFEWPPTYTEAAASAASGANTLIILVVFTMIISVSAVVLMFAALCCKIPSWLAWGALIGNFLAAGFGTLGTMLFISGSEDIRTLLKTDSLIPNTAPDLAIAWSTYLTFAGNGLTVCTTFPLFKAIWWATGTGLESLDDKVLRERAARVKQYLNDRTASTYATERHPVDNAPIGAKRGGWTKNVVTAPANQILELDTKDGSILNPPTELIVNSPVVTASGPSSPTIDDKDSLIPSKGAQIGIGSLSMQRSDFGSKPVAGFRNPAALKAKRPPTGSPLAEMRSEFVEASNARVIQTRLGGSVLLPAPKGMESETPDPELAELETMIMAAAPMMTSGDTISVDAIHTSARTRAVCRSPLADRPEIEAFVSASATHRTKNHSKHGYETEKVQVVNGSLGSASKPKPSGSK